MGYVTQDLREINLDAVAAKAAVLTISGVGIHKQVQLLSEEFGYQFTRTQIKRLEVKDTYIKTLEESKKNIIKKAVAELRQGVSGLVPKIIKAIEVALDEGNIAAITPALKVLGIENLEPDQKQSQNITVVLPGQKKDLKDVTQD